MRKAVTFFLLISFTLIYNNLSAQAPSVTMSVGTNLDIDVCTEVQDLVVEINFNSSNDTILELQLATGISYYDFAKISSTPSALAFKYVAGSDPSRPRFIVGAGSGRILKFSVGRMANCSGNKDSNRDTLAIFSQGMPMVKYASDPYSLLSPNFSLGTASNIANAMVGESYTSTRKLLNGSYAPAKIVYIAYTKPEGLRLDSLTWRFNTGSKQKVAPYNTIGETTYYLLKDFPSGKFSQSDSIFISENITLTGCTELLGSYVVGWMCEEDHLAIESDFCQEVIGTPIPVSLKISNPRVSYKFQYDNFENLCNEWSYTISIWNSSPDKVAAAAYYDVILKTAFADGAAEASFDPTVTKFNKIEILMSDGSYSELVYTLPALSSNRYINIDFAQFDDIANIPHGLSSLSADGIYNDLMPGDTIAIRITQEWICNTSCTQNNSTSKPRYILTAKTACGDDRMERFDPAEGMVIRENPGESQIFCYDLNIQTGAAHNYTMNLEGSVNLATNVLNNQDGSRWQWEFNFPDGIKIRELYYFDDVTDVEHENPIIIPITGDEDFDVVVNPSDDNHVTITTKENKRYLIFVDFYYDPSGTCGTPSNFSFEMRRIDDINAGCSCSEKLMCYNFNLNLICPGHCDVGPVNYLPRVRRVDSCLGYTDANFTTRWTAAQLTTTQLQRAIPTDTIQMISHMKQVGTADSLFLKFSTQMVNGKQVRLEPIKAVVTYYSSSVPVKTTTILGGNCRISTGSNRSTFIWNLTDAAAFDSVSVTSYYYLKNLTTNDSGLTSADFEQQGISHYFYNKNVATGDLEIICYAGNYIPEFYMVTPTTRASISSIYHTGCEESTAYVYFSDGMSWYGRNPFPKEIRPARYWDSLYVKIEKGLLVNSAELTGGYGDPRTKSFPLTTPIIDNDTLIYVFHNDGTWRTGSLGTNHSYLRLKMQFSCNDKTNLMFGANAFYKSIYANAATASGTPAIDLVKGFLERTTTSKANMIKLDGAHPKITTTSQLRAVADGMAGTWTLEVQNLTRVDAPNVWITIDTSEKITINSIAVNGVELDAVGTYAQGLWLKLDTIKGETKKAVVIQYKNNTCDADTLPVNIGWNCDAYPLSVAEAQCASTQSKLIHPQIKYSIELNQTPTTLEYNICDTLRYECVFNNTGEGNSVNNFFKLTLPHGLKLCMDSVRMQYPNNGVNPLELAKLTNTTSNNNGITYTYSIDSISTFDHTKGMPGVFKTSNIDERKVRIRFLAIPYCDFEDKSSFTMQVTGNQACDSNLPCGNSSTLYNSPSILLANIIDSVYRSETIMEMETIETGMEITITSVISDVVPNIQQPKRAVYSVKLPAAVSVNASNVENLSIGTLIEIKQNPPSQWNFTFTFTDDLVNGDVINFKIPLVVIGTLTSCEYPVEVTSSIEYANIPCGKGSCPFSIIFEAERIIQDLRFDTGAPDITCQDIAYRVSLNEYCTAEPLSIPNASLPKPVVASGISITSMWNDAPDPLVLSAEDGVHTVTWYVTDNCGNTASCEQQITITVCPCALDVDGNQYLSAWIGDYCWTLSNMKATRYGSENPVAFAEGYNATLYPDVNQNIDIYGRLYSWYSAVGVPENDNTATPEKTEKGHIQGVCPDGWYMPSNVEFEDLTKFSVHDLKAERQWIAGATGSNSTRFEALPAGIYLGSIDKYYNLLGETYFWITNETLEESEGTAQAIRFSYFCNLPLYEEIAKNSAGSVRCVKEF